MTNVCNVLSYIDFVCHLYAGHVDLVGNIQPLTPDAILSIREFAKLRPYDCMHQGEEGTSQIGKNGDKTCEELSHHRMR